MTWNHLRRQKKNSKKLQNSIEDLKGNLFYFIRNLEESSLPASTFYIELLGYLHDLSEDLTYLAKISYDHLNNNHRKLTFSQIKDLLLIEESVNKIFKEGKKHLILSKIKRNLKRYCLRKTIHLDL